MGKPLDLLHLHLLSHGSSCCYQHISIKRHLATELTGSSAQPTCVPQGTEAPDTPQSLWLARDFLF